MGLQVCRFCRLKEGPDITAYKLFYALVIHFYNIAHQNCLTLPGISEDCLTKLILAVLPLPEALVVVLLVVEFVKKIMIFKGD